MLAVFGYVVLLILVGLVVFLLYIEAKRKKAIEENKKAITRLVGVIKEKFKAKLNGLVEDDIISVEQHNMLYRVANNFFVFQPMKPNSVKFCEFTLNNIIGALQHSAAEKLNVEAVNEQVTLFVQLLPRHANEYSARFYRVKLPALINHLVTVKQNIVDVEKQLDNDTSDIDKVCELNAEDKSVQEEKNTIDSEKESMKAERNDMLAAS